MSWGIPIGEGVRQEPGVACTRLRFTAELPDPTAWTDPGWTRQGDVETRLPTFMRTIAKKKETFLLAGSALKPMDGHSQNNI